jgi:hypothetical protein
MTRSFRILLAASAAAFAFAGASSASAGSITLSDPNCDSFTVGGTAGNQTLTCVVSSPPVCTVQGPSAGSVGTPITLTAQCSPAATSWAWTGCSSTTSQCQASASAAGPLQYQVLGSNANGPGPLSNPLNVTWTVGAPAAPTGCVASIVTSPTTLTNAGGTATVSVFGCSPGGVTYNWSRNGQSGWSTSAAAPVDSLGAGGTAGYTNSYQVSVCNGATCINVPSNPLTAFVPGSGGGGGAGFDLTGCTFAGYTGRGLDVTYPAAANTSVLNGAQKASPGGTFGNSDALVVRFTTPASGNAVFQPAGLPPSQNTSRVYALSTQPCQFATSSTPTGAILYAASGQSPAINIILGACSSSVPQFCLGKAYLQPNTTYYVTMVNRTTFGGGPSCSSGNCDMRIDFNNN